MLNNPVLHKEIMRMRMRQGKPARIAILSFVALAIAYFYWISIGYLFGQDHYRSSHIIWTMTVLVQFLLIGLLTPSATANAISQEREQQTWDMLLQTRLTGRQIIFGKLLARMVPSLAIILLGLPVTLACVLMGARSDAAVNNMDYYISPVGVGTFLLAHIGMLIIGTFFATFGLYMSMKFKRTLYALLATYGFIFGVLGICTFMLTGMISMFSQYNSSFMESFPLMWINPFYIAGEICSATSTGNSMNYVCNAAIGLCCYALFTALMLTRLVVRFRSMAIER